MAIAFGLIFLFWVANRAAYKGYFHGDDLDNLAWNQYVGIDTYVRGFLTPRFDSDNFRPTGHLLFFLLKRWAGLYYPPYVAVIQIIHVFNACVLWQILKRVRIPEAAGLGAVVIFLFHPATLAAYWLPMYVFDLLCGTFCLLSLLFFMDRRWLASFLCFWLAYKAKELAVMLPAMLVLYEYFLGERRWKPLAPFVLGAASFGIQALIHNRTRQSDYTLRLTPTDVLPLAVFYGQRLLANWWVLAAFLAACLVWLRDRRILFAVAAAVLPASPLLLLPRRVFAVYLYVSISFLAIGIAALLARRPKILAPLALLAWVPMTFAEMKRFRSSTLGWAAENRQWMRTVSAFIERSPATRSFVYDGFPASLHNWGVTGGLSVLTGDPKIRVVPVEQASSRKLLREPLVGIFVWNGPERKLFITSRNPSTADASFVRMDVGMPVWQFGEGWYLRDGSFRWTKPVATAEIYRPATASEFELQINVGHQQIRDLKQIRIKVYLDGEFLGDASFTEPGWHTRRWPVQQGPQKLVSIRFVSEPEYRTPLDPRLLGAAIGAFGFR